MNANLRTGRVETGRKPAGDHPHLHGHGRTPLGDRRISLPDMGDDRDTIVKKLVYGRLDAMGDSLRLRRCLQACRPASRLGAAAGTCLRLICA